MKSLIVRTIPYLAGALMNFILSEGPPLQAMEDPRSQLEDLHPHQRNLIIPGVLLAPLTEEDFKHPDFHQTIEKYFQTRPNLEEINLVLDHIKDNPDKEHTARFWAGNRIATLNDRLVILMGVPRKAE
jgi:hypothetical protein